MFYYTGYTISQVQVALGYAFALGLGVGFILSLLRFILFSFLERGNA